MPLASTPTQKKRNRKRKRRAASTSSSSSSSSDSTEDEEALKITTQVVPIVSQPQQDSDLSSSSSSSSSDSDSSESRSDEVDAAAVDIPGSKEKELKDRFRQFWMTSVADGFKDDLEEIRKEPNLGTSRLALLIDSLAAGADVFSSSSNKDTPNEMDVILN